MSTAPVFFTIAAVQTEPLHRLRDFLPDIQDLVRKQRFSGDMATEQKIELNPFSESPTRSAPEGAIRARIYTPDRRSSLLFSYEGLYACMTTDYRDRVSFLADFANGLRALEQAANGLSDIRRTGCRMLDRICPGDHPDKPGLDWFLRWPNHTLRDATDQGWQATTAAMQFSFQKDQDALSITLHSDPLRFTLNESSAADVLQHALAPELLSSIEGPCAVLDIDSYCITNEQPLAFGVDKVLSAVGRHKDTIGDAFRRSVTEQARRFWGIYQ